MAQEFTMPKLGLTMTDGTIREWLVADGTRVNAGDPVLVIETDKVETEVEAREDGVLVISGAVGENYECGAVIGQLLGDGEAAPQAATESAPIAEPAPAAPTAPATASPAMAGSAPVTATAVAAEPAAAVSAADIATRGEGDRILASPMARAAARNAGVELAQIAGTGPGGRIVADDVAARIAALASQPANGTVATTGDGGRVLASPMARAAARDRNVDLAQVAGTGPGGRIVADDVTRFADDQAASPTPRTASPAASTPVAAVSAVPVPAASNAGVSATGGGRILAELLGIDLRLVPAAAGARVTREDVAAYVRVRLAEAEADVDVTPAGAAPVDTPPAMPLLQEPSTMIPMRGMRSVIAERMHGSLTEMAQLTLTVDADMTAVNAERARLKGAEEPVPGYTAWVIAAASRALVDHPYVNSQVTADGIAHLPEINLGVAVALDDGLIVPVIGQANTRAPYDLHTSVADLASRARDGKLKLNELEGGTFSVTALGMYGVDGFTPVINPPNTAILGVGRLRTETRWQDGVASPMTVMTLSLTWDHRAFDGAPAAEFAQSIVRYLENPAALTA